MHYVDFCGGLFVVLVRALITMNAFLREKLVEMCSV